MEKEFKKGTVLKDPYKNGVRVFSNRQSRMHHSTTGLQDLSTEQNDWIQFKRESDYNGLSHTFGDEVKSGEDLRTLVEEKLFYTTLDGNCLGALSQDDISEEYCKGRLPNSIEKFVEMILSCPVVEDEEDF